MSRKYDTKRRKKWNRRILLCKTLKELTLTHVKSKDGLVWLCADDIIDSLNGFIMNKKRNYRKDLTLQELLSRLRPMLNSDFMERDYTDESNRNRRYRTVIFAVSDIKKLEQYIEYCSIEVAKI